MDTVTSIETADITLGASDKVQKRLLATLPLVIAFLHAPDTRVTRLRGVSFVPRLAGDRGSDHGPYKANTFVMLYAA
jgi:hypothetical protein